MSKRRPHTRELRMAGSVLISSRRDSLARAVARQIQATVPRYRENDLAALAKSAASILRGAEVLLLDGDDRALQKAARSLAELRMATGFEVGEFLVAGLCFFPVLRRYFTESLSSLEHALDVYESVEAVLLPFVNRATTILLDAAELERTSASFDDEAFTDLFLADATLEAFSLEGVSAELNPEAWARQEAVTQPAIRLPREFMEELAELDEPE